jgi:hypothetical protein
MKVIILYVGSIVIILWGIAHIVIPTKGIVQGFGPISMRQLSWQRGQVVSELDNFSVRNGENSCSCSTGERRCGFIELNADQAVAFVVRA